MQLRRFKATICAHQIPFPRINGDPEMREHWSDCAVNNGPAYEPGPCDCGGYSRPFPSVTAEMVDAAMKAYLGFNETVGRIGASEMAMKAAIAAPLKVRS